MTQPSPLTWTLRLKHHRTTVLLHVNPLQTFASVKTKLLDVLAETQQDAALEGRSLPSSPSEIVLGRPVDINDPSRGFVLGEWERSAGDPLDADEDAGESSKVKGKAVVKGKGRPVKGTEGQGDGIASSDSVKDCLKGAGLRDGAVLAFKWRPVVSTNDDEMDIERDDTNWDVSIPSYDDPYGVENTGDVGGRPPFEG